MLNADSCALVVVDVQGKLAEAMHGKERLFGNLQRLVRGARALNVPVVWMEQSPAKMGPTIAPLRELLAPDEPISKTSFSCCGEPAFARRLEALARGQILLAGIEAHVCVFQTARDLVARGYEVEVVSDAVSSRAPGNARLGLERCLACGARLTGVEMLLFELMRTADHPAFRDILRIVK
ncbi:MAG: hydrolase [Lentisphaerae bacterium]|nr:hydrolase [Lentisphaerota bacterium]